MDVFCKALSRFLFPKRDLAIYNNGTYSVNPKWVKELMERKKTKKSNCTKRFFENGRVTQFVPVSHGFLVWGGYD